MSLCAMCLVVFNSVTSWTVASQAPLSMEFYRQEYWSGLPFSSPGDLPDPGIEPTSLALADRLFITEPPGKLPPPCQKTKTKKSLVWMDDETHKMGCILVELSQFTHLKSVAKSIAIKILIVHLESTQGLPKWR